MMLPKRSDEPVTVIGGGLAGVEAAWQLANKGCPVELWEMRPEKMGPAHSSALLAELVCSNSLRSNQLTNAAGLLKEEMRRLGSLVIRCADETRVPAGGALAVDRWDFSRLVTDTIVKHPLIHLIRKEAVSIPDTGIVILASGPLTSPALASAIKKLTGESYFYFYDAAAPIVTRESINMDVVFPASRYGKGEADYLNCPMSEKEYYQFYDALVTGECHPLKDFEKERFFEGCMPVEVMAKRGPQTLLFGPLKPVGLIDPKTGKQPFAVVQLRRDNKEGTLYNIVGFQTHLKWSEQERIFRMIPGLERAEFVRFGVMHRNTFINSPKLLSPTMQLRSMERIFFAGQITGVEGYIESASNGLVAGINAARLACGQEPVTFPPETATGALCHYICQAEPETFQPMNINFGLLPPLPNKIRPKKARNEKVAERALLKLEYFKNKL